ncbi:MAG: alpha/beta fold hydrolase [Pacificimonas sp.]|jgi:pimeloyl-ACP methyl ester carboxylesterase|nr:alpha/beta fold hydrolase [Pacificimonas sp.]
MSEASPASAAVRRAFVDGPHGQMHLRLSGDPAGPRPPIVLLHMFPQSSRNFSALMTELGKARSVIAPDFPGYGESTPPSAPITAEDYAGSIWSALDTLCVDRRRGIDLFGIHAGAKLAVEAATQRPAAVRRLALCSAALVTAEETAHMRAAFRQTPLDEDGTHFARLWSLLLANRDRDVPLAAFAEDYAEMLRGGEAYGWGNAALFDYNPKFQAALESLDQPVLVINPGDDLHAVTPRVMPHLKHGQLIEKPDWRYGFLKRRAPELAALLAAFFDDPA